MPFLPPDPPADGPPSATAPHAPKASPASVLAAPRAPVTQWNRRYLAAGAAILAAIVAAAFWIGFSGGGHRVAKKDQAKSDPDTTVAAPAFADKYSRGYGDPSVQAIADDDTPGLALSTQAAAGAGRNGAPSAQAAPVD